MESDWRAMGCAEIRPWGPVNEICTGHRAFFRKQSEFNHSFGGSHSCHGADYLNCGKPLMLHWTLDLSDPRLNLGNLGLKQLLLFYCMRCELCVEDFSYQILRDSEYRIVELRLQSERRGEITGWRATWDEFVGLEVFPKVPVTLCPIPERIQELWRMSNAGRDGDAPIEEWNEVPKILNRYFSDEDGERYPLDGPVNQIGGRGMLYQRPSDPPCPVCRREESDASKMKVIATFTESDLRVRGGDTHEAYPVTYEGVQIVWFLCTDCRTVKVIQRI
jgi:hypothetical protein